MAVPANEAGSIIGHGKVFQSRRLEAGGIQPFIDVSGSLDLARLLQQVVPLGPGFSRDAFRSRLAFCSANRSANVRGWESERNMGYSFPVWIRRERAALSATDRRHGGAVIVLFCPMYVRMATQFDRQVSKLVYTRNRCNQSLQ